MIRTTTAIVGAAAFLTALILVLPTPASTPQIRTKFQGRTAFQWHSLAVARLKQRDRAAANALEATRRLRRVVTTLKRQKALQRVGQFTSPLERNMLCIHSFEGSWTDPNGPYYGGMQMDDGFQKYYGREYYDAWGSADHWPVSVQLAVAMKAYLTRGYGPWPNTARYCGLR